MRVHSSPLENFDFAFNPTLDRALVEALVTADFVQRGENLLILGGPATAKTTIASAVIYAAQERGLAAYWLHGGASDDYDLLSLPATFIGGSGNTFRFVQALVDCDLLVVDDVYTRMPSLLFLTLLRRRTKLGKSTILIDYPAHWQSDLSKEVATNGSNGYRPSELANEAGDTDWVQLLNPHGFDRSSARKPQQQPHLVPVQSLLAAIGVVHDDDDETSQRRPNDDTATKPVWHTLNTGDRSYREHLRSQGLL